MAEEKPQWMSIGEAAKYLGVSRDTLRRWGKKGKIKAIRSPTNRRYYTKKQLDKLMGASKEVKKVLGKKLPATTRIILAAILSSIIAVLIASAIIFFFIK